MGQKPIQPHSAHNVWANRAPYNYTQYTRTRVEMMIGRNKTIDCGAGCRTRKQNQHDIKRTPFVFVSASVSAKCTPNTQDVMQPRAPCSRVADGLGAQKCARVRQPEREESRLSLVARTPRCIRCLRKASGGLDNETYIVCAYNESASVQLGSAF